MTAREYVRVARALKRLPTTRAAFREGALSYAKVRAITRIATPEDEARWQALGRSITAAELERCVRSQRRGIAVTDPAYALRNRSVRCWTDDDGMAVMLVRLPPSDGAFVHNVIRAHEDSAGVSAETEEPDLSGAPPAERRRADGLVSMARASLTHMGGDGPTVPYAALIHVDASEGALRLDHGPQLSAAEAERALCDALIVRVTHYADGRIDAGRATRIIGKKLARAIRARDAWCGFPGCHHERYTNIHHIRHWTRDGPTNQENLILLCSRHHRLVHEGGWSLRVNPDGLVEARSPDGRVVTGSKVRGLSVSA